MHRREVRDAVIKSIGLGVSLRYLFECTPGISLSKISEHQTKGTRKTWTSCVRQGLNCTCDRSQIKALFDTGNKVSIISSKTLKELLPKNRDILCPFGNETFHLTVANQRWIFWPGKSRKKSDSVSETVSIYVKFCNKRPQTKDMDFSTMD